MFTDSWGCVPPTQEGDACVWVCHPGGPGVLFAGAGQRHLPPLPAPALPVLTQASPQA